MALACDVHHAVNGTLAVRSSLVGWPNVYNIARSGGDGDRRLEMPREAIEARPLANLEGVPGSVPGRVGINR